MNESQTPLPVSKRLQSASIGNIQKVSGYPLFVEETPNLQTRQAPVDALENVMQKALKQYEDNLKQAKQDSNHQIELLNNAVE